MPRWKTLVLMAVCFAAGYATGLYDTIHALNKRTVTVNMRSPNEIAVCNSDSAPKCEHVHILPKTE